MAKENYESFGKYCSEDYYKAAIDKEQCVNPNARFFVFSDDIDWAKENLKISNAVFVSGNDGDKSWIDMYLMSLCGNNIIANSTFSYWAARLNIHNSQRVYYPRQWFRWENPDIFPDSWIAV